jgi:hypothetical protein
MKATPFYAVYLLTLVVVGFAGLQLYRYNITDQPTIIKVYRYKNNKLVSSEVFLNDEAKNCKN